MLRGLLSTMKSGTLVPLPLWELYLELLESTVVPLVIDSLLSLTLPLSVSYRRMLAR